MRHLWLTALALVLLSFAASPASGGEATASAPDRMIWDTPPAKPPVIDPAERAKAEAFFFGDGVRQDFTQADALLAPMARRGDPEAQFKLGIMKLFGHGPSKYPRDISGGVDWLWCAAGGGHVRAATYLGRLYADGVGLGKPDLAKARLCLERAAKLGDPEASKVLGIIDRTGRGIQANLLLAKQAQLDRQYAVSLPLLETLAEFGLGDAMFMLGAAYHEGEGVPQDRAKALEWTKKAAEAGETFAQINLGEYLLEGDAPDVEEAYYWFRRAGEGRGVSEPFQGGHGRADALRSPGIVDYLTGRPRIPSEKAALVDQRIKAWKAGIRWNPLTDNDF
ncbi:MAG: sel1 repeat family protein [Candidatus Riflebacteria bacterium]|nr:sel1 repeat family protein [Candidatus Riflebacteria bacterium]